MTPQTVTVTGVDDFLVDGAVAHIDRHGSRDECGHELQRPESGVGRR
ncbi:MAG: hypothetical protein U0Q11_14045 [Vicinamibacterales bacterium]